VPSPWPSVPLRSTPGQGLGCSGRFSTFKVSGKTRPPQYISKDGTNNGDVANVTEQTFNSVAEFKAAFPRYNRSIRFQTSAAQDAAALKAATGSSVTKYRFLKNNCGHTYSAALNAAGKYSGASIRPNTAYKQIYKHYMK